MKRREFLTKGGLVSAGIVASVPVLQAMSKNIGSSNMIHVGIIGTGDRGGGLIPILNTIEGINVSAVCDVLPFRLENGLSRTQNKAKAYTNYEELLSNKDIDAVLIATPFNTHAAIAIDAIDAGKHVYCEKTMAKGLVGIDDLVKKTSNTKTIFQTGHQYHSSKLYKHVVEFIKKGELGQITSFECQWNRNGNWRRPVPELSLERAINWRMYKEYSGGMAAELCSHQIDFVNWVLGENPKKIMGTGGIDFWKDGRETFDNIHLLFEYPSGVKAKFTCLTNNALGDYQIKVHGSKGTILLDYTKAWIYYENGYKKEFTDVDGVSGATANTHLQGKGIPINISHIDPSKQALVDFRNSILDNKMPVSNIYTGANTAVAVQLSLDAMHNEEIQYWKESYSY
ncbi:Gfo/Idh/MocA family protein [Flavivirga spongiicola]|uniref:Gfo/Idh/MocA family oxidoreductase n=1 Tax=Flavivirga spongiicola TaxID=421621 RepID=A0ABU7XR64_9FLAO|nr:Gfo/Idh/MocA family oxidoreductase [Flavivirga sp. MEBiC05379]MDO5977938.1 Gfo/Idh/MocA family oxidoreductase [Flavivirga sp. MEBiC05379]